MGECKCYTHTYIDDRILYPIQMRTLATTCINFSPGKPINMTVKPHGECIAREISEKSNGTQQRQLFSISLLSSY